MPAAQPKAPPIPEAILAQLTHLDRAPATAGVEALIALGDPALFDALLDGIDPSSWGFQIAKRHPLKPPDGDFQARSHTLAMLFAAAPDGTAAAARRALLRGISFDGNEGVPNNRYARKPCPLLDLTCLAAFPALTRVDVQHAQALKGLDGVLRLPALVQFQLEDIATLTELDLGTAPLTRLQLDKLPALTKVSPLPTSLTELRLTHMAKLAAPTFAGPSELADLTVIEAPLPGPASSLPRLHKLWTDRYDDAWLRGLGAVTELVLFPEDHKAVPAVAALASLTELSLNGARELTSVAGLGKLEKLEELSIHGDKLTSLAELAGGSLPALRKLDLGGDGLTSLAGLEVAPNLIELYVFGCPALTDLTPLAGLSKLEQLRLTRCTALTDLTPLAGCKALVAADFSDSKQLRDFQALAGLKKLKELKVSDTRASHVTVPERLHPIVHPPSAVKKAARRAPRGPKAEAAKGEARTVAAKLKRLVLTRDFAKIDQGIELLRSLADPALDEALLSKTKLERVATESRFPRWRTDEIAGAAKELDVFVPNATLAYGKPLRPYREHLLRALIAWGSGKTAKALRPKIRALVLSGSVSYTDHHVDLAPLAAFPALVCAIATDAKPLAGVEAVAECKKLSQLFLLGVAGEGTLSSKSIEHLFLNGASGLTLGALPRLRRLNLSGDVTVGPLPALEDLELYGPDKYAEALPGMPKLKRIHMWNGKKGMDLSPAGSLRQLEELRIQSGEEVGDWAFLAKLPRLQHLRISQGHESGLFSVLPKLKTVERLWLQWDKLGEKDIAILAKLPKLKRLELENCTLSGELPAALKKITKVD